MDMIFRPMAQTDYNEMRALFNEMGEESASFFNIGHCNENLTMRFFTAEGVPTHEFYVASDGDAVLGYVFLWELNKTVPWFGICVRE